MFEMLAVTNSEILIVLFIAFYFVPILVATIRKVPNIGSVAVINVFLGWTLVGWVVALSMAARSAPTPPTNFRDKP
jgi:hypothetical protein